MQDMYFLIRIFFVIISAGALSPPPACPKVSPRGIPNLFWEWRGQTIRYQCAGLENTDGPTVLLVHGLFVNADHWQQNLPALAAAGVRCYAIDLLGNGYSSKPLPCGDEARAISGENGRDLTPLANVELGTANGGSRTAEVALAHPLGSAYNFYTWAEQLADFTKDVIGGAEATTLVCNSIGTISALQAITDWPNMFNGCFVVNPNFRELHVAESPKLIQPVVRAIQSVLRSNGQPLFDSLAKPDTVKQILLEPYADPSKVTDELVDVLLSPLLQEGSADVVFDTLSYSAGPLPEQLLADIPVSRPIWVCWGTADPWTPGDRVKALDRIPCVEKVVALEGVGHCPHDEAPELVNPLILDFVGRLATSNSK